MSFQFKPALSFCFAIALAILISLGVWQIKRLAWKTELIAQIEARQDAELVDFSSFMSIHGDVKDANEIAYYPVNIRGLFKHDDDEIIEAHVYGTYNAQPGWYIFSPFEIEWDSEKLPCTDYKKRARDIDFEAICQSYHYPEYIYINRGFVSVNKKEIDTRFQENLDQKLNIQGYIRAYYAAGGFARFVKPVNNPDLNQWHDRDMMAFSAHHDINTYSFWIDSFDIQLPNSTRFELQTQTGTTDLHIRNKHLEYALTWFGLAIVLTGIFLVLCFKRRKPA